MEDTTSLLIANNYQPILDDVYQLVYGHKGKPGEAIVDAMIKSNTPDVELVSGATMSSLVIRSAVIDALENGIK